MTSSRRDGRRFAHELLPLVKEIDGKIALLAPAPGLFRKGQPMGIRLVPCARLGELEVLGALRRLVVPDDVEGVIVALPDGSPRARIPMAFGTQIVLLDPEAGAPAGARTSRTSAAAKGATGLVFKTPLGGRYYARPAPDAEAFVKVGDEIGPGTTIAIVEVMKTFNRVQYGGATGASALPPRAKVTRLVRKDGDDVASGDALLELEPCT
jgi:acetyl-CoA carboxylase biotin carboxyl carrier protein